MPVNLFKYGTELIAASDLERVLRSLEADQCDVLYIHSGMSFGLPNLQLGRMAVLEHLADIFYRLDVPTLLLPTYTFSFCNAEIFDRENSVSSMGALNEYLRVKHNWLRSCDPLMSNIAYGKEKSFITEIGKNSVSPSTSPSQKACNKLIEAGSVMLSHR